jgi:hypothetical protein
MVAPGSALCRAPFAEQAEEHIMNYGFENIFAKAQDAMAPLSELTEFGFDTFEKGLQFQAELMGDALDFATEEMKLLSSATSPSEYFQGQVELAQGYAARAQKRAQALGATATEMQAALVSWAEQGFKQAQSLFEDSLAATKAV